jgi:hypothetical protein
MLTPVLVVGTGDSEKSDLLNPPVKSGLGAADPDHVDQPTGTPPLPNKAQHLGLQRYWEMRTAKVNYTRKRID